MTPMSTPNEQALNLILRGLRFRSNPAEMENERQLVREYFGSITIQDLNSAIAEFEHSTDPGERWAAAQALIAYFRWCWMNGRTQVGAANLNDVVLSFAQASCARIAGAPLISGEVDDGELLPEWRSPDIAFGFKKPNSRPVEDNDIRDIAIAMHVESLRRDDVAVGDAKKAAAKKFGVSVAVVAKAMTFGNGIGFGRRFIRLSVDDLKNEVADHFTSKQEKTTR